MLTLRLNKVAAQAADKVTLMINWYVYGEHAPFYYGKAKGIYAAEGIDLEIQEGRGSAATTQAVAAKTANFGYVDVPTMMRAAVKGAPIMATGVPGMGLNVDGSRYFWFHHTDADTPDKLDPKEVQRCVAAMAVMAYIAADLEQSLR